MESIYRSIEIIENRIAEKLTVAAIAQSVHFSKFHYQRLFREIVGESVMAYVMKRKHELAGEMLCETDAAVLDVALAFGFDSHEGFTRSFKSHMGATPSNYRKRGKFMKPKMEIERELNALITAARETAEAARREAENEHSDYLRLIAAKTDAHVADLVAEVLAGATDTADRARVISNRLSLATGIGDAAFNTNVMALSVALAMHRGKTAPTASQKNLSDMYYKLAETAQFKAEKARGFFAELSALIFDDMRKTAAEKVSYAMQKGNAAADAIVGHENVKFEVKNLVGRLEELSLRDVTALHYDDALFQFEIIAFAFEADLAGATETKKMLAAMDDFRQALTDAVHFFRNIPKPEPDPVQRDALEHRLTEVAFQGHILLFYTRGEIERAKRAMGTEDRYRSIRLEAGNDFDAIVAEINTYIQTVYDTEKIDTFLKSPRNPNDQSPILAAVENLHNASAALRVYGGSFGVLAEEFENLAKRVLESV